ncbi:MAG: DUF397 domain-containing protein [Pseudonocardia sp.]
MLEPRNDGHPHYRKSPYSGGGNCVEVCLLDDDCVAVRDSKNPDHVLRFTADEWAAFVVGVKLGFFDVGSP